MTDPGAPRRPAFLVDSHLPRALATALTERGCDALHLADWRGGAHLNAADSDLLTLAAPEGRAVITYNSATLPLDAYALLDAGAPFAGVLVVTRAIGQRDVGSQARAVLRATQSRAGFVDEVVYLQPVEQD